MSNYDSYLQYLHHVADTTKEEFQSQLNELEAKKESEKEAIKEKYDRVVASIKQELVDARQKMSDMVKEHTSLVSTLKKEHTAELKSSQKRCKEEYEGRIEEIKREQSVRDNEQQVVKNNLEERLAAKDKEISELKTTVQNLTSDQQPIRDEVERLIAEVTTLKEQLNASKQREANTKTSSAQEIKSIKSQHQKDIASLESKHQSEVRQIKERNEQTLTDWNGKFEKYKSEVTVGIQAMRKEIELLNQQIKEKDEQLNKRGFHLFGK